MFNKEIKPYKTHDNKLRLDFEGYCLTLKRGKLDAAPPLRAGIPAQSVVLPNFSAVQLPALMTHRDGQFELRLGGLVRRCPPCSGTVLFLRLPLFLTAAIGS